MKTNNLIPLPVLAIAGLFFAAVSGSAQTVLLTASEYALLGATAITVGGPGPNSVVNGNVGLSPAATTNITGFPPGVVSGITLAGNPAAIIATGGATLQAQADLLTARNALFAMPQIPANDLSNLDLGGLAALRPGVYFSTSATNQTGNIVLDANFENSVAWVFNFSLSLTTAANSNVTFINLGTNGGADNGLYWNAATAINVGDNNTIVGNYLAGTAISFTGITATLGAGGSRALAGSAVTFAGPGAVNALGGPSGGDYDGGLTYVSGALVPWAPAVIPPVVVVPPAIPPVVVVPPAVVPPGAVVPPIVLPPAAVFTGNVLLSSTGLYAQGSSVVILVPGIPYPTTTIMIDGNSSDGASPASLTITNATATLSGTGNTYTAGTFVDGGALTASTANLPVNGKVVLTNGSGFVIDQAVDATFGGLISGSGTFSKTGTAALTLTGVNSYTGGTTVVGGTLIGNTTSLQGAITNNAAVNFNQASAGTYASVMGGTGSLTKSGAGTLTLSGANTHTGGTTVSAGTLTIAGSGKFGASNNAVAVNGGTLDLANTNQTVGAVSLGGGTISNGTLTGTSYTSTGGTVNAVLAGTNATFTTTAGTTTLNAANTYTGATTVNGGTLVATSANLPQNGSITLGTNGVLSVNQSANGSLGGNVSGGGTILKSGTGVLTVANTTTARADVRAGSLLFTGGMGATNVADGAFLGGNGTITGNLTNNGTVSPGTSPGTINVTGNYTQSSTGLLFIEVASAASFDRLIMTGTAALAGTLQYAILGGFNPLGQSFTFLTASAVSGTFGTLTGTTPSAATAVSVVYAPTSATLVFTQLPFAGFAQTPNQAAVGAAAQATPAQTAALNTLPLASQFPAALNAISPQGYQVWSDFAFARSTSLADRLLRGARAVQGHDEYYFEAGKRHGRSRSDADVGSSRYTSNSGLVGGNRAVNPNSTIGAFFSFGKTTSGLGSAGSQTILKDKIIGLRSGWADGPLFAEAMLAYGFNRYESTRPIMFSGTSAIATSSTRGHQWTTGLTVGKHLKTGALSVSPFGGLLLSRWTANGFTEQGAGIFNATVGRQSATSLRSQLGAEARVKLGMFQPHVRAAWLHEFYNDARRIGASFGNVNYSVRTRRAPRDTALYSAGLDVVLGPSALVYANVTTQSGGTTRVLDEWNIGLSVTF